jgi:hypothetical protein
VLTLSETVHSSHSPERAEHVLSDVVHCSTTEKTSIRHVQVAITVLYCTASKDLRHSYQMEWPARNNIMRYEVDGLWRSLYGVGATYLLQYTAIFDLPLVLTVIAWV